jgi:acetyl-CoA carboxylase biotin carboxyl carrier protein
VGGSSGGGGGARHGGGRRRHRGSGERGERSAQPRGGEASLNIRELRELVELFTSNGLTDFEFENEEIRVRLSKNSLPQMHAPQQMMTYTPGIATIPQGASPSASPSQPGSSSDAAGAPSADASGATAASEDLHTITSPIVGTFYRSPSPTSEPFVRNGSQVEPDTTVCIIEAMKLMNEIQAEVSGVVEKIYVENGQPVEFGQPLFGIRK